MGVIGRLGRQRLRARGLHHSRRSNATDLVAYVQELHALASNVDFERVLEFGDAALRWLDDFSAFVASTDEDERGAEVWSFLAGLMRAAAVYA